MIMAILFYHTTLEGMSVRQYIGARYVTKIYENTLDPSSAEWQAGVTYEPLTLVTYLNGSYLSKKTVPGAVGDPASNPAYWAQTGFYNGQISSLQAQIDEINNTLYIVGPDAKAKVAALKEGEAVLLENVRFHAEEEKNNPEFAKKLADLADIYVNDAFGTAHRAHCSTVGVVSYVKEAVAGYLIGKEIDIMGKALSDPARPS